MRDEFYNLLVSYILLMTAVLATLVCFVGYRLETTIVETCRADK